jgi:hypothetical protein
MRVTFATVEEFCRELEREAANGYVWRRQVRVRIDRAPEQDDEITFTVAIWGTAAVTTPDGDYLMEYGEICGSDDTQAENPSFGTEAAHIRKAFIQHVAKQCGLEMADGKLEVL